MELDSAFNFFKEGSEYCRPPNSMVRPLLILLYIAGSNISPRQFSPSSGNVRGMHSRLTTGTRTVQDRRLLLKEVNMTRCHYWREGMA